MAGSVDESHKNHPLFSVTAHVVGLRGTQKPIEFYGLRSCGDVLPEVGEQRRRWIPISQSTTSCGGCNSGEALTAP